MKAYVRISQSCESKKNYSIDELSRSQQEQESSVDEKSEDSANDIEDSYPLSPIQQGMLFNTLLDPGSGVDIEQLHCDLHETIDTAALKRAWTCVMTRHPVLRTNLRWENLPEPRQDVHAQVELPWEEQDWSGIAPDDLEQEVERFLNEDRRHGFDLARAPLFRLTLLRRGEARFHLVWTLHHAILDGRSFALILPEVFEYYEAFRRQGEISLPLPRPYRDYIAWLQQQNLSNDESYWRAMLKGFAAPTPLVVDRAPETDQNSRARKGTQELLLPAPVTLALRELARQNQISLNTIVQGGWSLLLNRYSGESDVLFGVVRANRRPTIEGADAMIGLFINTLPLRVSVNPEALLIPWLKQVHRQWMDMRGHTHASLASIQAWSDVATGRSLFHSTVTFENQDLEALMHSTGGPSANRRIHTFSQTNYPLDLTAYDGTELRLRIDFDRRRIDAAAAARMLGHLRTLLCDMADNPRARLKDLRLLPESERRQLLVEWNDTARALPDERCMHEIIAEQAARNPDAMAVVSDGRTLSYGELDRRANQLAHALRKRGVGPDFLVGLCVERSAAMIVALLGVLKAGGAYVPLDPDYPAERFAFMLEDCGARLLITEDGLRKTHSPIPPGCEVICLDKDAAALAAERRDAPRSKVRLSNLAYAIYTSGSTGQPKAVLLTHRGLVNLAASEFRLYGIGPKSRVLQFASLSFDASLSEIAMALCSGATLYVERRETILPGPDLEHYLEREQITVLSLTPSALAVLDPAAAPSVEQLIVGGEPCPAELAAAWAGRCRFFNTYGPTETTIVATYVEYGDGARPPNIGRPLPNVRAYILDRELEPVPVGVPGELYIGGIGVARGYLNRQGLTAERFLPDPFHDSPEAVMYRSGDFVRWRPDGHIEFIGRIDNQVKIRGYRIELGEIETCIEQHPDVRQVVVIAWEDMSGDKHLVAYVVVENPPPDLLDQLRAHLKRSLPEYMVPAAFVTLDKLPLTPNDKVDLKALPAPEHSAIQRAAYVAPRTPTEEALTAAWCEVLQVEHIGVRDNFFDLGGHSLLLARLISKVNLTHRVKLGVPDLIQNPTVEQVANLIDKQRPRTARLSTVVPLQEGQGGLPVYFIYAGPSEFRIARQMGEKHAVFGIEARWPSAWRSALTNNEVSAFPSMQEMVAPYVAALRAHTGSSPCALAGLSYAGRIAFEAAHQLQEQGGKVELVFLIDAQAEPPSPYRLAWQVWRQDWKRLPKRLSAHGVLQSLGSRVRMSWQSTLWVLGKIRNKLKRYFERPQPDLETLTGVLDEHGMPLPWGLLDRLYGEIDKTYALRVLNSRGVLLRTAEIEGRQVVAPDDTLGWGRLFTQGVEIVPLTGDHYSIFGAQIPTIAREIDRALTHRSAEAVDQASSHVGRP